LGGGGINGVRVCRGCALQDVGVETIMVRYPREGQGVRETKHAVDVIERSIAWDDRHFRQAGARVTNGWEEQCRRIND
jgi:hypothetical protein